MGMLLVGAFMGAIGVYGSIAGGHLETFRMRHGELHDMVARMLGYGLDTVTINGGSLDGLNTMTDAEILKAAGITGREAVPFLDVEEIRARLEALPLVKAASVRKFYPHTLQIEIKEREPFAIWQNQGELAVIAGDGTAIFRQISDKFAHLPFVVGEGANKRVQEYAQILEQAGPLRGRIKAAILVSERRWTLKFDNGLDVRLPENNWGDALTRLIAYVHDQRLLDRDILAVDMRLPDRITLRLTEEAASAMQELRKKAGKGGSA
jgi:cell division protein FtsQ